MLRRSRKRSRTSSASRDPSTSSRRSQTVRSSRPLSLSSRSMSRTSIKSRSIDRRTKQFVFHECPVCTLDRKKLKYGEGFSQNEVNALIEKHYKKRQSHARVICLEDRLRFEKNKTVTSAPYRSYVKYKNIEHFYIFDRHPDAFTICVNEGDKGSFYESYKCKSAGDVRKICELVCKARDDPQYLLRDIEPLRQYSVRSESSVFTHNEPYKGVSPPPIPSPAVEKIVEPEPMLPTYTSYQQASVKSPPIIPKQPIVNMYTKPDSPDVSWEGETTYLSTDPIKGPRITENGPIYMFAARTRSSHY